MEISPEIYPQSVYKGKNRFSYMEIKYSSDLAGLVADLMGDGHLQGPPKWRFDYCSNSLEELKRFERKIFSIFKVKGKVRECKTNKYGTMNYGVNYQNISKKLFSLGVPSGNKTNKDYLIPNWIINNKECFREFVNRYFCCEATVERNGDITLTMYKRIDLCENGTNFLNQIREGLEKYFSIKTTKVFYENKNNLRKDGSFSKAIKFKIKNKSAKLTFFKEIELDNPSKRNRLEGAVKNSF